MFVELNNDVLSLESIKHPHLDYFKLAKPKVQGMVLPFGRVYFRLARTGQADHVVQRGNPCLYYCRRGF